MSFFASQCRSRMFLSRILTRPLLVSQIPDRRVTIRSEQFPEYSLLYDFDKIRGISGLNRTKRNVTGTFAISVPTLFASQALFGLVTTATVEGFVFFGAAITIFFHSIGLLINNSIGYIYIKNDDKTVVKISHVGYWGGRVDVDTTTDNIIRSSCGELLKLSNPWYEKIHLVDSGKTYKLFVTDGRVLDHEIFDDIFRASYS